LFSIPSVLKPTFQSAWKTQSGKVILLCLLLFGLVFWTFLPSLHGNFIDIDDGVFVVRNTHFNLTLANVAWAFCHTPSVHWLPLTLWSLMLDHQFYGLKPWGYHLTNVLLHAVNTVLLFLVLRRMMGLRSDKSIGAMWRSLTVAALFGLHPLRVESVAWISERKDVLSVTFWMLTLWAYVRYVEKSKVQSPKSKVFYGLTVLFFALDLMSKPMVVTLPCVLLLLDYWPLERWKQKSPRSLLVEKAPFFLLSAIGSAVTYVILRNSGVLSLAFTGLSLPFGARLDNALVSYGRYLGKLFWPVNLCAFYPHPDHWPMQTILLAGLLVPGLSVLAFVLRRQQPYLLTGWLWYLGTLVPVIGLAQAGDESMADRYSYIPSIGILIILAWGTCQVTRGWHYQSIGLGAAGGVLALVCIGMTRHQIGYWKDEVSLWRHAVAVTGNNYQAHNRLGCAWFAQGRMDESIREFQEVVRLNPGFAGAYNSLGRSFAAMGRMDEALACYQKALDVRPGYVVAHDSLDTLLLQTGQADQVIIHCQKALELEPDNETAHINLGSALFQKGRVDEAIVHYQKALQIKPDNAEAHHNLGTALFKKGRVDEAIVHYQKALQIKPDDAEACLALGEALKSQKRFDEAIACYQKALEIQPDYVEAHNSLGSLLLETGQADQVIIHCQKALELEPDNETAHINLGSALFQKGRVDEAIVHYQKALQIKPDNAEAHHNLGTALFQKGRVDEAIVQYQKVLQIKPDDAEACSALGYALNSQGRFDEAIVHLQKALEIKPNLVEAHYNLGFALCSKGRLDEAIRELQETLKLKPDYAEASNNLVIILGLKEKQAKQSTHSSKP
jgi:tetratricopeptide (TPR) repeat protein